MTTEALTQYKLMILYLLQSVNYPLTNSQLSGFFLDNEYTTYFTTLKIAQKCTPNCTPKCTPNAKNRVFLVFAG